jgi:hypothetical protein
VRPQPASFDLFGIRRTIGVPNVSAQRHFEDTIQRKRTLDEVRRFLPAQEIENLEKIYHGSGVIVWGAVPGSTVSKYKTKAGSLKFELAQGQTH